MEEIRYWVLTFRVVLEITTILPVSFFFVLFYFIFPL